MFKTYFNFFSSIILLINGCSLVSAQILLPKNPQYSDPKLLEGQESSKNLNDALKNIRKRKSKKPQKKLTPEFEKYKQKLKVKDIDSKREMRFVLELAVVGGAVVGSGDVQGYTMDPNMHINFMYRSKYRRNAKENYWVGFRVAPFTGNGLYKKIPSNYGFLYFGPMIGIGTLSELSTSSEKINLQSSVFSLPSRSAYLFSLGVSMVSKLSGVDPSVKEQVSSEFSSKAVTFDSPGLWAQFNYFHILLGAFGVDFVAGIQKGKEKTFIWAGVGVSAWH